jgi:hypothetical protein
MVLEFLRSRLAQQPVAGPHRGPARVSQYFRYIGEIGELELLPEGTVERELAERGERLYQLSDLDELLAELRKITDPLPSNR